MVIFLRRILNHCLANCFETSKITSANNNKVVYLTFDDGPEPGITEFVLDELQQYDFKATFFCRGDNAENYPELLRRIKDEGHSVGNHTYSHLHSYECSSKLYCEDVERANRVLNTKLFRPPHGSHTLSTFLRLRMRYKSFFWSLNSGDSDMDRYDYSRSLDNLKKRTKVGEIVLFHFCHKHQKETRELLPVYLTWLAENGYRSNAITM